MFEAVATPDIQRLILHDPEQRREVEAVLGLLLAENAGHWSGGPTRTLRTRLGEWLLRGAAPTQTLPVLAHLSRLTPSLAAWQVTGANAATLLAMDGTLDFERFAPWTGTRTLIARIPAIVSHLDEDSFEVLIDRSYADYFATWMSTAALRFI